MSYDVLKMIEIEVNKKMDMLETEIKQGEFSEDRDLKSRVENIEKILTETEKEIRRYEVELNTSDNDLIINTSDKKINNKQKLKEINQKFTNNKKKFKKLRERLTKYKDSHINSHGYGDEDETTQSISFNSFNKLQQAARSTIEMENMSGNILGDLNTQSGQMKGVSSKVGLINEDLDSSNGILVKMISRQNRDKKLIILLGIILSVIFLSVLIYKLVKKFK